MLIIILLLAFALVLGIAAITTLIFADTDIEKKFKDFLDRQYAKLVRFVKWAADKPVATWPVLLGACCIAMRAITITCPKGILHWIWGDWVHVKVIIPFLSDLIEKCIKYIRQQNMLLRFIIKIIELLVQLCIFLLVVAVRIACNPDVPLVLFWMIALPVFVSILIWTTEERLPKYWRRKLLTDRDGGERPIEGLRNKVLFMCVAEIVVFVAAVIIANKMPPLARMPILGSMDVVLVVCAFITAQVFTTMLLSLQLDGDTVAGDSGRVIFWDNKTTYIQYHYTMLSACVALSMLLILLPFCNTALFAYKRLARSS